MVNPKTSKVLGADDPPPLKWSDLRYVFDIQEDCNGKEAQPNSALGKECDKQLNSCSQRKRI